MMPNMQQAMKQFQKMQEDLARVQEELNQKILTVSAGGGAVTVEISGKLEIKQITVDPEVVAGGDQEMLQDLLIAAVNEAIKKAQDLEAAETAKITGNLKIPGMPF